jgi:hypothetical protein
MSIYHEILGVPAPPKVVGRIALPDAPQKHKCTCDECGCEVDDRFGDPRIKVEYFDSMDAKNPSSIRMICEWCANEQFGDDSPNSIFNGTPDWMRML